MKKFFLRVFQWQQGLEQAAKELLAGEYRHDVLERGIRTLELDPEDDTVGYGGFPNILGKMELDAAFMDGNTRMLGAVAAVENFLPVRIARRVMEEGLHTLMVGAGAELFANECGLKKELTFSEQQREKWEREIRPLVESRGKQPLIEIVRELAKFKKENFDTTVMLACDGNGLSAAASTSGWPYKFPGRVGDTPLAGAGVYVDSRYGGAACTYTGEMSMRAATARYVVTQLENGKSVREAVHSAIKDISELKEGLLRTLTIHAVNREGDAHVATVNADKPVHYCFWREDMSKPDCRIAEPVDVPALHGGRPHVRWRHLDKS